MSKRSEWVKNYRQTHRDLFAKMMRDYRHRNGLNKKYYSKYSYEAINVLHNVTTGDS